MVVRMKLNIHVIPFCVLVVFKIKCSFLQYGDAGKAWLKKLHYFACSSHLNSNNTFYLNVRETITEVLFHFSCLLHFSWNVIFFMGMRLKLNWHVIPLCVLIKFEIKFAFVLYRDTGKAQLKKLFHFACSSYLSSNFFFHFELEA